MSWPPRDDEHVDAARVVNYMRTVMAWMDGTEWVERYYWYGARWNMVSRWCGLPLAYRWTAMSAQVPCHLFRCGAIVIP